MLTLDNFFYTVLGNRIKLLKLASSYVSHAVGPPSSLVLPVPLLPVRTPADRTYGFLFVPDFASSRKKTPRIMHVMHSAV